MKIEGRLRAVGIFNVHRLLPYRERPSVGPFVFFDHAGPADLAPGQGMDVPPHPHIGLATVTYLFEGRLIHRDSLGSHQLIRPGDINWMTAGRGIVHSERTGAELRSKGSRMNGLQLWVALPLAHEETEPEFHHHSAETLPGLCVEGAQIRVLAGSAYGRTSPVRTFSPMFFADVTLSSGSTLPVPQEHPERAAYVIEGALESGEERVAAGSMLILGRGEGIAVRADSNCRLVLLGGAPLDGERQIWWNFVSSSKVRLEQTKRDWIAGRFPKVPGDEAEFVALRE
jgi:redox-sensitive bicupin YhaK (pirin superfamily)